ncbi:AAA family ATPase [Lysobacter soli]|uniref:AAA family ATPase n=1 Tax=Lysobacter soli TaxID=453783 RepID=UPI0012EDD5A4|nr:AAA family ATPase [Lysobacter soli]QGW64734.1 AAA family ATPase [Lysobacter soli]
MAINGFAAITIEGWRQFKAVNIELHPRLTVLTGANGAGKSTILSVFSQHFGWHRPLLATPVPTRDGVLSYFIGLFSRQHRSMMHGQDRYRIGSIRYANGNTGAIYVPGNSGIEYGLQIDGQQHVEGVNIPSHRPVSRFQQVASIPTSAISPSDAYSSYFSEIMNRFHGGHSGFSPAYRMKEALISMAAFGEGNRYLDGRPDLIVAYTGFIEILQKVLPPSLGFETLAIRPPDVVMVTKTGQFLIDAASGGLAALIDLTWQIYMFTVRVKDPVVVMDEPENHLHPAMQRTLMSRLVDAFPGVQFIVATHSPFIISSERDSNVYALRYEVTQVTEEFFEPAFAPANSVVATKLDLQDRASSANDILREVLGLETTLPVWVEERIQQLADRVAGSELTAESYRAVSDELRSLGLGSAIPRVIEGGLRE